MTLGLLTKTAIFPLHVWLPPAHANAPAPVSALLSALVVKGSLYLLLRLWLWVFPAALTPPVAQLLGLLGAAAVLYGSLLALCQTRIKLLVAYSTVAQLGYVLLLFPLAGALAWGGAVYQILSHAFAKAALFLAAGNILQAWGHDRLRELSGLTRTLPLTLYAIALAGVSLMGLPPSGGFIAKWLLLRAAIESGQWWWAVIILVGGLLAAAYLFRLLQCGFISQPGLPAGESYPRALPRSLEIIPLLLAAVALGLGFIGTPTLALLNVGSPFAAAQATP
jgi:formate hydrogenlyase subunit 3/multisubunit Na+/H+ antiporter MnhD subunit